jgi:hypothetical protein
MAAVSKEPTCASGSPQQMQQRRTRSPSLQMANTGSRIELRWVLLPGHYEGPGSG